MRHVACELLLRPTANVAARGRARTCVCICSRTCVDTGRFKRHSTRYERVKHWAWPCESHPSFSQLSDCHRWHAVGSSCSCQRIGLDLLRSSIVRPLGAQPQGDRANFEKYINKVNRNQSLPSGSSGLVFCEACATVASGRPGEGNLETLKSFGAKGMDLPLEYHRVSSCCRNEIHRTMACIS